MVLFMYHVLECRRLLEEREIFIEKEKEENIREKLINLLKENAEILNIKDKVSIKIGGSVGIAIYPNEYDKKQILDTIHQSDYEKYYLFWRQI